MADPTVRQMLDSSPGLPPGDTYGQDSGFDANTKALLYAFQQFFGGGASGGTGGASDTTPSAFQPRTNQGSLFAVPAGTTNGTAMPNKPTYTDGFTLYMAQGDVVTGYFHDLPFTPSGVPSITVTYDATDSAQIVDVPQAGGNRNFFVTATSGSPTAIWVQR
jgi:hypothetical protein